MTPSYDYPQAVYTAAPRLIEACFELPSFGAWWYSGSNSAVDYKLTLGRLITNVGSDVKALMAETTMVNGKFPSNQATSTTSPPPTCATSRSRSAVRTAAATTTAASSRASGTTARTA